MIYKEFGKPHRQLVRTTDEMKRLVRLYNGKMNCYMTIYGYTGFERVGYREVPLYDTAIVDKVYMDFDGLDSFDEMLRVHQILNERDTKHILRFSGNGFHLYAGINTEERIVNKGPALKRYSYGLTEDQDPRVVGDISRIARIPYTLHMETKRYCIPLCSEDLIDGVDKIIEKARTLKNVRSEVFGNKLASIKEFDYPEDEIDYDDVPVHDGPIDDSGELPTCVQDSIDNPRPGYFERFLVFTFFRECGISMNAAIETVKCTWDKRKLRHALYDEKQPQSIYRNKIRFPSRKTIYESGLCKRCGRC